MSVKMAIKNVDINITHLDEVMSRIYRGKDVKQQISKESKEEEKKKVNKQKNKNKNNEINGMNVPDAFDMEILLAAYEQKHDTRANMAQRKPFMGKVKIYTANKSTYVTYSTSIG